MALVSAGYFSQLLSTIGINRDVAILVALLISFISLFTSPLNLILKEVKREAEVVEQDVVFFFGYPIFIPRITKISSNTLIAVNFGGALIPATVSIFLIYELRAYLYFLLINVILVALLSKLFSRVIRGVGVVMHPLIPSLFSVLFSYFLFYKLHILVPLSAYVGSVLGTLIGADLLNLKRIVNDARPQIISIGGMGTFDGIFVSGIIAIFISELLLL